jgi:hypothetical protein
VQQNEPHPPTNIPKMESTDCNIWTNMWFITQWLYPHDVFKPATVKTWNLPWSSQKWTHSSQ